ncbi:Uncharacterised protein [uncultured archaeon]|nr:Uncharacterised protein [uncultured archaeon]
MKRTTRTTKSHEIRAARKRIPPHGSPMCEPALSIAERINNATKADLFTDKARDVFQCAGYRPNEDELKSLSSVFYDGVSQSGLTEMTANTVRIIRGCENDGSAVAVVLNCLDKMKDAMFFDQALRKLNEASGDKHELTSLAHQFIVNANVQKLLAQGLRRH